MFGAKHSVRFDVGIAGNIQCGNQWLATVRSDYKVYMRRTIRMTPLSAKQHSHRSVVRHGIAFRFDRAEFVMAVGAGAKPSTQAHPHLVLVLEVVLAVGRG